MNLPGPLSVSPRPRVLSRAIRQFTLLLAILAAALASGSSPAQQAPPTDPPPSSAPLPATPPPALLPPPLPATPPPLTAADPATLPPSVSPATTAVPVPAPPAKTITKEQTVYVPFNKLEEVFEDKGRGVFLPYREFLEMWNQLNVQQSLKEKKPPVEGVLAAAHYTGKVEGNVAQLQGQLSFEALKKGWSKLTLGAAGLALAEAKSTATLSNGPDGYEMLFPDKGTYTLDATIFGKISRDAGRATLALQLPKTAVSQFELLIPEKGLEFTISPAAAYSAVETPEGATKLLAYFGGAEQVSISWTHRVGETALKPLLFADTKTDVRIGSGAVRTDVAINFRILRAGVEALDILVPADQQVLSAEGENIREWTVEAAAPAPPPAAPPAAGAAPPPKMQRVHLALHTPARDTYSLRLKLERALGTLPEAVPFPLIQAAQAERQIGTVTLATDAELTAEISGLQELTQQAAAPAPKDKDKEKDESVAAGAFRYLRVPYAGIITVAGAKPQVEVTSQTLVVVNPDLLEVRAVFDCVVKRAGIFGLQIDLPAGLSRVEATGEPVESSSVQTIEGKEVLNVKFRSRQTDHFAFTVTGDAPRAKPDAPLAVPVFGPRAERHEARIGIAIHVSLKANTTDRGELREEDVRNLIDLEVPKPDTTPLTLGFRYRGAAKPAQIQFELRKPRVSAQVSALMEVKEALLRHVWTVEYQVEYAGVDEFQVAVPEEIADDVQIEGSGIKERTKLPPPPLPGQPPGTAVWKIVLQSKVLGPFAITLTHDSARAETKPGETAPVTLLEIRALNVFRETGQIAVVKDGNIEIVKNEAKGLELIDPKELGSSLARENVFLAWKYSAHPISLRLDVAKNLYLEVPTALVSYAVLASVIAEDEAETTEAIYWMRNNGQQFFSVELPGKNARLLSDAYVDGEPQQPSRRPDHNELLIRLPSRGAVGDAFPVRFVYEVPSTHPGKRLGWSGTLHLEPPRLAGIETLQTRWSLYLPADHRYVGFDGPMREIQGQRGWDVFRSALDLFVPQFGPILPGPGSAEQAEPPSLPAPKKAGFNTELQREGALITLRRLGEPAAVGVAYRSKGYAATLEALAFLLAFAGGLRLLDRSRRVRFWYFIVVGVGALVIAGAVSTRSVGFWQAIYLGALGALLVWLLVGAFRALRAWRTRQPRPNLPTRPVHPVHTAHPPAPAAAPSVAPAPATQTPTPPVATVTPAAQAPLADPAPEATPPSEATSAPPAPPKSPGKAGKRPPKPPQTPPTAS